MKGCLETFATISSESACRSICGQVKISSLGCGSVIQAHIRGLPGRSVFFGFSVELCGRTYPLPPLLSCDGEALMSVYTGAFQPEDTPGGQIVLTPDPCSPHRGGVIACGRIVPCVRQPCCPPQPRPLFAAPIRR